MAAENMTTTEGATTALDLRDVSVESSTWFNESEGMLAPTTEYSTTELNNHTLMVDKQQFPSEYQLTSSVLQAFIIIEIVMTALELILSILAAFKVARWRRNYRNQMLMQLSLVRFIKRVYTLVEFLKNDNQIADSKELSITLTSIQIYIDFVIVILVCFFIKHMYNSLIVVLVKTSKNKLVKVISCAWLIPVPISAAGTAIVVTETLTYWSVYLLVCAIFRWPLMLIGTLVYLIILIKVLFEDRRKFARSLTVITFLLCLVINGHLFCKDVIWLWCIDNFLADLITYILGFIMNILILSLYIVLITLHLRCRERPCDSLANYSEANTKC